MNKRIEYCPVCGSPLKVVKIHRGGDGWIIECEACKNPHCNLYGYAIAFETRRDPRICTLDDFSHANQSSFFLFSFSPTPASWPGGAL